MATRDDDDASGAPGALWAVVTTGDGSRTLSSRAYKESYHSRYGAVTEARHVFLEGAGVMERLSTVGATVLEVGFGTGLNFLVTADMALATGAELHYAALEREVLPASALHALEYGAHLKRPELWDAYLDFRNTLPGDVPAGRYTLALERVQLALLVGEAVDQTLDCGHYDAVYHDAFSPEVNPELWEEAFLAKLHAALRPGGVLSSYSVKGAVRRRLAALGFAVHKRPGPPNGKREMLVALKPG